MWIVHPQKVDSNFNNKIKLKKRVEVIKDEMKENAVLAKEVELNNLKLN